MPSFILWPSLTGKDQAIVQSHPIGFHTGMERAKLPQQSAHLVECLHQFAADARTQVLAKLSRHLRLLHDGGIEADAAAAEAAISWCGPSTLLTCFSTVAMLPGWRQHWLFEMCCTAVCCRA